MKNFALFFLCVAVMGFSAVSGLILLIPLSPEELAVPSAGEEPPTTASTPNAEVIEVEDLQVEIIDPYTFSCKSYAFAYSGGSGMNYGQFIDECTKMVQQVEEQAREIKYIRRRLGGED